MKKVKLHKKKSIRCTNFKEIKRILSDPSVFFTAKDDGVTSENELTELILNSGIWLKPHQNTLFLFKKVNHITYDCHVAIIEGPARKFSAKNAVKAAKWLFENTPAQKIMGFIPEHYESAIMLMKVCGGLEEGRLTKSWLSRGIIQDMVLMGITKDEFYKFKQE